MSRTNDVTTSFRLSRGEAKLIRIGLGGVINGDHVWKASGSPWYSSARMLFLPTRRIDEGAYDPEYLAIISRVIVATTFTGQSRRLRLDPFELGACTLAVRVTEMMVRHGHTQAWLSNHKNATRRLLAKIERLRKRAKRAFIRVHGHAAFSEASQRWQRFVRFARAYFLFCRCNRARLPGGIRVCRRHLVQDWIHMFKEELPGAGLQVPAEKELRNLVRRALRSVRRLTADMGVKTVRRHGASLRDRIRKFVTDRCRRLHE